MRGSSRGRVQGGAGRVRQLPSPAARRWETLAEELFAVTAVVDGNASLRRALADPSRDAADKRGLARALFGGKVGETTTGLVAEVAGQRWSAERDLGDTLESLAVQALLAAAEREGRIDRVEDELFRFERIVAGDPGLRDTLSSRNRDGAGKADARARAARGQGRPGDRAARRAGGARPARPSPRPGPGELPRAGRPAPRGAHRPRHRRRAALRAAAAPACAARSRRTTARPVTLQVVLDPRVMGGIRVQVGDEVVDGTVLRRLEEARRHVTGG